MEILVPYRKMDTVGHLEKPSLGLHMVWETPLLVIDHESKGVLHLIVTHQGT